MSTFSDRNLQIRPVAPQQQMESLKLLLSSLSPTQQLAEAQRLFQAARDGKVNLDGLLRAERDGRLVGVIWAQTQPGRTAVVWRPQLMPGQSLEVAHQLITAADGYLAEQDVCLAQVLSPEREMPELPGFEACGYEYLAELEYLASMAGQCDEPALGSLVVETYGTTNRARFVTTLERTYDGTRDCPALNGVRRTEDVLAGYQSVGTFSPERWFLLRYEGRDAGCLLLADHAETDQYELVYVGLVSESRGHGLGELATRYAQWQTRQAGRARLVLAVDAGNEPAKAMYASTGFVRWEHRHVWLRRCDG